MAYCDFCANLTIAQLDDNDVLFHPNLNALRLSASAGCPFCTLCYTRIQEHWTKEGVAALLRGDDPEHYAGPVWYPSLWLRGEVLEARVGYVAIIGEASSGCCIWLSCGKFPDGSYEHSEEMNAPGHGMTAKLAVYATEGSAAASQFRERFSAVNHDPNFHISMARSCLEKCRASHKLCASQGSDEMPTRVIHVGDPARGQPVRLLVTNGLREPYLALSYCWGPDQTLFKLNKDTKAGMLAEINETKLAKTYQDAISFSRSLGVRYIWIDALCIIQGDANDWAFESQRMAEVYGNAMLSVIAGRSDDARLGFVAPKLHQDAQHCPIPLLTSGNDVIYVCLPRSKSVGPVDTRGWCFQEKILSRRALVFGKEQISFQCRTTKEFEDGYRLYEKPISTFLTLGLSLPDGDVTLKKDTALKMWYGFLEEYTMRNLSNPHDIFAAIVSVAKLAQSILGAPYLAGIWETDIARGLLWKPRKRTSYVRYTPAIRPKPTRLVQGQGPIIRAPSWSWASVEGPARHYFRERTSSHLAAMDIHIRPKLGDRWTSDVGCDVSTLHMPSCELHILGRLARALTMKTPAGEYLTRSRMGKEIHKAKLKEHGKLLISAEEVTKTNENWEDRVVAIGLFDVMEEMCEEVWCLLVLRNHGLMLARDGEKWKRLGWFSSERDWFEGRSEVEIKLV